MAGVRAYDTSDPAFIDAGPTYEALTGAYAGLAPYPVDLIVDEYGTIVYVSREYDPDTMFAVLDGLL